MSSTLVFFAAYIRYQCLRYVYSEYPLQTIFSWSYKNYYSMASEPRPKYGKQPLWFTQYVWCHCNQKCENTLTREHGGGMKTSSSCS